MDLHHALPILQRTPTLLRTLLADLPPELTHQPYGQGTWSAAEVVAHLIHGERTDWIPRARHILSVADARPFTPFDRQGHATLLATHSLARLLDLFESERNASLDALRAIDLSPAALARPGAHPALGPVTLHHLLATWVVHDLNHLAQIAKAIAHQLRADVGPWQTYLSILAPPNPR